MDKAGESASVPSVEDSKEPQGWVPERTTQAEPQAPVVKKGVRVLEQSNSGPLQMMDEGDDLVTYDPVSKRRKAKKGKNTPWKEKLGFICIS
jgi:hypothetical protein